jgi:2-aminomuconate deaminase
MSARYETQYLRGMSESISTSSAPKPVGSYPHARRVGNLLFLSGVGPRIAGSGSGDSKVPGLEIDENGNVLQFDFAAQVHAVFANVKAVLDASGSSWGELVDVTVFLVNMERDFSTFNEIYAEYFPSTSEGRPCRTTVEINCLPTTIAIELKCIATVKNSVENN